jgi:hypothetical protein
MYSSNPNIIQQQRTLLFVPKCLDYLKRNDERWVYSSFEPILRFPLTGYEESS